MSQKIKTSVEIDGSLKASQIANATTDTDKFLVSDDGTIKYRTSAEILSDLGITLNTASKLQHQVKAGVAINKGQAVYVTSADGTNMIVGLASNASEATSSKTMGLLNATVVANGFADVVTEGLLDGLDTSTATVGNPVWLGTGGNLIYGLANKPYAPNHLVFIGIVTRVNANNGEIFVKVQNGFELDEIHDVDLKTTTKVNGHLLGYNGSLWVNKTIAEWLGYTPYNASNPNGYISSYTETDPTVPSHVKSITTTEKSNWNTAFGWGNHALAGYLTSVTNISGYARSLNGFANQTEYTILDGPANGPVWKVRYDSATANRYIDLGFKDGNGVYSTGLKIYNGDTPTWQGNTLLHAGNYSSYAVPTSRTITINGTSYDLSANRSWTVTASETDTLATVTARGNTTTGDININGKIRVGSFPNSIVNNGEAWIGRAADRSAGTMTVQLGGNLDRKFEVVDYGWTTVNFSVNGYGAAEASGSMRAPIFYDSNNTGYYVDPASTSNFNAANFAGSVNLFGGYGPGSGPGLGFENQNSFIRLAFWGMDFYDWNHGIQMVIDNGYVLANNSIRSPIFYDSNDTGFYLDPNSTTTSLVVAGAIKHSGTLARPSVQWGQSGNVTGALVIKLPGTSPGNYGMIHAVIDIYEYNANNVCTVIVGGHNWSTQWHNFGAQVIGKTNKQVRLAVKDGKYCIVLGDGSSVWEYGQVVLRKIQNGTYYNGTMDLGGAYSIGIESDSYSWVSSDLRRLDSQIIIASSQMQAPIYYDYNNTAYYIDPNGTSAVNAISAAGYVYSSSYLESAGAIYGTIFYDNNNRSYYCDPHSTSFFAGLQANSNIQSPIFYDYNNTGYYLDPASSSNLLNVYVSNLTASSIVYSSATGGFASSTYAVGQRNPIWRFANADGYGLSYFQGTAGDASQDTIGFHFGTATAAGSQFKMRGDGVFFASNDIIAFSSSDRQLKDNISPIENALEKVKQIGGYTFDWNNKQEVHHGHDIGVIAQEIESVLPEIVTTRDTGFKAVKYEKIVPLLIEAIKEQQTQIEELKELVNKLINK